MYLSICLLRIPQKLLDGLGWNFAQGWRFVPDMVSRILVAIAPGVSLRDKNVVFLGLQSINVLWFCSVLFCTVDIIHRRRRTLLRYFTLLSLDKHVNVVSAKWFFQLRYAASATLVHAFVASRVYYCGSLLIGAPRKTTDKLQCVVNSAARIVSNTRKFDRGLTHFRRSQLYTGWMLTFFCRPGSVHSLRPGVQMFAQGSSWIPVYLLRTRLRHFWPSPPAIGWPWSSRLPTC